MALGKLAEEDPTFTVRTDEASGQTIISGMGELHLDIIVDRLRREFKVEVSQGQPQVEYKEAITQRAEPREVYKKQSLKKHGFPFIIAVRDFSKAEILSAFQTRLAHDSADEFETACRQVERIAELRLQQLLP